MLYKDLFPQSDLTVFIIASTFTDHIFIQQIFLSFYYVPYNVLVSEGYIPVNKKKRNSCSHGTLPITSVQFSHSVMSDSLQPMNCSTPGLPVHHQLPEFTQTHVHQVSDAIQPSHPLSSPSPPAPNPSQHQSLFQ